MCETRLATDRPTDTATGKSFVIATELLLLQSVCHYHGAFVTATELFLLLQSICHIQFFHCHKGFVFRELNMLLQTLYHCHRACVFVTELMSLSQRIIMSLSHNV